MNVISISAKNVLSQLFQYDAGRDGVGTYGQYIRLIGCTECPNAQIPAAPTSLQRHTAAAQSQQPNMGR